MRNKTDVIVGILFNHIQNIRLCYFSSVMVKFQFEAITREFINNYSSCNEEGSNFDEHTKKKKIPTDLLNLILIPILK